MDDIQSIRNILTSYISTPITNLSSRQKAVVQKMLFLDNNRFKDLLEDVDAEIKRRLSNKKSPLPKSHKYTYERNKSRFNLSKLNTGEFENLCIDVYLVLNYRFPSVDNKNIDEIELLIEDLDELINNLKDNITYEQLVIEQINNERDLKIRLHIYNKYVKRMLEKHNEDLCVANYVENILMQESNDSNVSLFELMDTNVFLMQADKYFRKMNMYMEEYDYHHGNLITLLDEKIFSQDVHEKIIRKEKKSLFELMLKIDKKSKQKEKSIENEINIIISTLSHVKKLLQSGESDEYLSIAKDSINAVNSLCKKLETDVSIDKCMFEKLYHARENLCKQADDQNIEDIPMAIFNMASLVKNILHSMPQSSLK